MFDQNSVLIGTSFHQLFKQSAIKPNTVKKLHKNTYLVIALQGIQGMS
jgi:hypothetical protein